MADAMSQDQPCIFRPAVRLVWLVDPETHTVTIFRQDAAPKTIGEGDTLDGGDVLPDFMVPVTEIFGQD